MAIRDNRIATESIGINITKYKLMAFVTSAALAGAAGALYGMNYSTIQANKFDFNTSILVLVFVVLGGLGNMLGSIGCCRGSDHPAGGSPAVLRLPDAGVRHRADPRHAGDPQPHAARASSPGSSPARRKKRRLPDMFGKLVPVPPAQ